MTGYVYHIRDPKCSDLDHGYIGVTKHLNKRWKAHQGDPHCTMHHWIRIHNLKLEDVDIIFKGDIEECYQMEKKLRPKQKMGWNVASGGGCGPYISGIEDLSAHRSKAQSERMKDEALKKKQGETTTRVKIRKSYGRAVLQNICKILLREQNA